VIRKIFQIGLWLAAGAYAVLGVFAITWGLSGTDNEDTDFSLAFGSIILIVAGLAAVAIFLANKWRGWLAVAALILGLGLPFAFFASFLISMEKGEEHQRLLREELDSGKYAFGDQPALFAIAHAIVTNNPDAIRAAAKAVPDLQAPGRDGTTLLCFAVRQTWQHRQLVEAVKTLLSLGADPNYTNGHRESFALANAVHSSAPVLRAMLEAGGNPNVRNEYGWPIIFMHYELAYYKDEERARLDLLLDHGADINSTVPESESECAGYTLLLYRTKMGLDRSSAYADALHLLERGADPQRVAPDGMTFGKMLTEHRAHFGRLKPTPVEFAALWDWAEKHGMIQQAR